MRLQGFVNKTLRRARVDGRHMSCSVRVGRNSCDTSLDAQHFLCVTDAEGAETSALTVVLNWWLSLMAKKTAIKQTPVA